MKNILFAITLIILYLTVSLSGTVFADSTSTEVKVPQDLGIFSENPNYEDRQKLYEQLRKINNHTAGWIYIKGTKVDNVLMQNINEKDFYIDRGFDRKYLYQGTLYISDISDLNEVSDVIIMYGHNMKDRSMFGSLREFEDPEFLNKYDEITIDNFTDRLNYEITHVMRIRVNVESGDDFPYYSYSDFKDKADFDEFIEQCHVHALYDSGKTVTFGDKLVMLTTCEYTYSDGTGRLVVMGKLQKELPEPTAVAITCSAVDESGIISNSTLILSCGGILLALLLIALAVVYKRREK